MRFARLVYAFAVSAAIIGTARAHADHGEYGHDEYGQGEYGYETAGSEVAGSDYVAGRFLRSLARDAAKQQTPVPPRAPDSDQSVFFVSGKDMPHEDIPKALLASNNNWAKGEAAKNQTYFETQAKGQAPRILWLGCSDSRLSPETILGGVQLGEVFVHRNIANVLPSNDLSSLSVITYAVEHLKVDHIFVTGHTQCGGVKGAIAAKTLGILDHWLAPIKAVISNNRDEINKLATDAEKEKRVIDLNVVDGVRNVAATSVVQTAWRSGRKLAIHGWVFHIETGLLEDLNVSISGLDQVNKVFQIEPATPAAADKH